MELPTPEERTVRIANLVIAWLCAATAAAFLWRAAEWQNSIRKLMELDPVTSAHPIKVCAVAAATFVILLGLARLFTLIFRFIAGRFRRFVPRRVANVIAAALALLLFWSIATEVFFRAALRALDSSFQQYDALIEPTAPQPTSPLKAGSPPRCFGGTSLDEPAANSSLPGQAPATSLPLPVEPRWSRSGCMWACAPPTRRPSAPSSRSRS